MARLFAYGTLEDPAVVRAVTGRVFASTSAILRGYRRVVLRHAPYPGIIRADGHSTAGTLYAGVDAVSMRRLDAYESFPYRRTEVVVEVVDAWFRTWTYVIPPEFRGILSDRPWDRVVRG